MTLNEQSCKSQFPIDSVKLIDVSERAETKSWNSITTTRKKTTFKSVANFIISCCKQQVFVYKNVTEGNEIRLNRNECYKKSARCQKGNTKHTNVRICDKPILAKCQKASHPQFGLTHFYSASVEIQINCVSNFDQNGHNQIKIVRIPRWVVQSPQSIFFFAIFSSHKRWWKWNASVCKSFNFFHLHRESVGSYEILFLLFWRVPRYFLTFFYIFFSTLFADNRTFGTPSLLVLQWITINRNKSKPECRHREWCRHRIPG